MSDYLTSLTARSLNAAPVITPRLASLFEPQSVAAGLAAHSTFETEDAVSETVSKAARETEELDQIAQKPSRVGELGGGLVVPRADVRALTEKQRKEPDGDEEEPRSDNLLRSRLAHATKVVSAVSSSTPAPSDQIENQLASLRLPKSPEGARVLEPRSESNPERLSAEASTHKNRPLLEPELKRTVIEQFAPFEPSRSVERAQPQAAALIAVSPRQAPLPVKPAVRTVNEAPANPEPPPAIRVTIGRVDVRAIMPQTPAPAPPPASVRSSFLSLADYLKQREGGRR